MGVPWAGGLGEWAFRLGGLLTSGFGGLSGLIDDVKPIFEMKMTAVKAWCSPALKGVIVGVVSL